MSSQAALILCEIAKPLIKTSLPIPQPSENQLLLKVTAAGLAPLDQKMRDRNVFNIGSRLPAVLAGDLVGTVVKGSESTFPTGSRIFSQMLYGIRAGGGLQEYTLIDPLYAAIIPPKVSDVEAALYPINAMTAALALFSTSGLNIPFPETAESKTFDYASQKLVIIGGGSNTGKMATQIAKIAGIGTIITTASISNTEELKGYGATHLIARQAPDIEEQVRAIVGDDLLYVYDTINFGDLSLGVSLLSNSKKGTIAQNQTGEANEKVIAKKKAGFEAKRIAGFSSAIPEFGQLFWQLFPKWLESGKVKPLRYEVIEGLDVDKVNAALDKYRDGKARDRYHIRIRSNGKL